MTTYIPLRLELFRIEAIEKQSQEEIEDNKVAHN